MLRRLAILIALLIGAQMSLLSWAQAPSESTSNSRNRPAAGQTAAPGTTPNPDTDSTAGANANQTPQIIVNPPAPPVPEWGWREQGAWAASIVLAILGYVGIMLALRTLKKIDQHVEVGAATAQAAMESATAALALAQAITNSERPWIVVTVEPFLTMESSFKVMAANRGRSPARIVGSVDQVKIAVDDTKLPKFPEFDAGEAGEVPEPIVLLPGEATGVWAFNREDLPAICKDAEALKRVERWQEILFLYGRITYTELNSADEKQTHETFWCCRYIHGEKNSALVMAGRPEYNKHS